MELLVGLILVAAAYMGGKETAKEVKQPVNHTFEQCAIACESNMKLIKTRFQHCECNERSSK